MSDSEREQYIRVYDGLIRLIAERAEFENEPPETAKNDAFQQILDRTRELRLSAFRAEEDQRRVGLGLARDLFVQAGGDVGTLPNHGEPPR